MQNTSTPPVDSDTIDKDESYLLCIFLVKSGSKDRDSLLFRYPYSVNSDQNEANSKSQKRTSKNRYALVIKDHSNSTRSGSSSGSSSGNQPLIAGKQTTPQLTELDPTALTTHNISNNSGNYDRNLETVIKLPKTVVSNLFAVKPELCNVKFEIKINNVRFVGHPLQLETKLSAQTNGDDIIKENKRSKDLLAFNVVFALKANANHDVVNSYWECSRVIGKMLFHEEDRDCYLSRQAKIMLTCHEEVSSPSIGHSNKSAYELCLEQSSLCTVLKKIYNDLKAQGSVHTKINDCTDLNLFVPQTVHRLTLKYHRSVPIIGGSEIRKCIESLEKYHTMLLLVEPQEIKKSLPKDLYANILVHASPYKTLAQIAEESNTSWSNLIKIVTQLVFSAMAIIIYPICESNVYLINPLASASVGSPLVEKFSATFNQANLLKFMSEFSLGASISQLRNPLHNQQQEIQLVDQVIWMLKHRLLIQLHTYVFLVAGNDHRLNISSSDSKINTIYNKDKMAVNNENNNETIEISHKPNQLNKQLSEIDLLSYDMNYKKTFQLLQQNALTPVECRDILRLTASRNENDRNLFTKLCPYFNGKCHIEHILYYERDNVKRSQLLSLIDKFRDVLITCQYEDKAVAQLCPYNCR